MITQLQGDCLAILPTLETGSVQTIVTSPPYWRMRKYTDAPEEIGQEPTPAEYVEALRRVFAECRRVLRDDGTLWLNLGDAYANDGKWGGATGGKHAAGVHGSEGPGRRKVKTGLPPKSLIGLPWRVAFALQDDGWILRNDIIWHKPNVMPEGAAAADRCTRDHEYVFMLSKQGLYYFDSDAIAEVSTLDYAKRGVKRSSQDAFTKWDSRRSNLHKQEPKDTRNARTVWSISPTGLADEHYAPMPQALAERCIRAGSKPGDLVLDPFAGSGTTLRAAIGLGRHAVGIELSAAYVDIQNRRTAAVQIGLEAA